MSYDPSALMQELVDETYVLVKKSEEQQKELSNNYSEQLRNIKEQNDFLTIALHQQKTLVDSLKSNLSNLQFILKAGFGGMVFGIVSLLISGCIWLYAHKQFLDNQAYALLLENYDASIPKITVQNGGEYIRIVPNSEVSSVTLPKGGYIMGYFAQIDQNNDKN